MDAQQLSLPLAELKAIFLDFPFRAKPPSEPIAVPPSQPGRPRRRGHTPASPPSINGGPLR